MTPLSKGSGADPPAFPSGAGLVSTLDDYLAFGQMILVGVLMTQRLALPQFSEIYLDFWTSVYQAIDD
jgi:hypothetical protein